MNKLKLFIDNFLVYGLGGIISKIIPVIMLPIITRLMPNTEYYGLSDLSGTVVQFGSALAIMGMYDAVFRMFFEKDSDEYKKNICSTALIFTLFTSVIVFFVLLLLRVPMASLIFGDKKYANLLCLTAISILIGSTNSIMMIPTRAQNKRTIFLITNTLTSVISYAVSIPLLLNGHYIIALPLASVVSALSIEVVFGFLNYKWFSLRRFNLKLLKQLLVIAVPLLPNFLIYWIFNSCDRLMIAKILGNSYTGIYSVGAKLGQASQLIYTAFAGGWQYFAFSTMKEENQVRSNSLIFEYLGILSFATGVLVCAWSYPIFKLLFTGNYIDGYMVAPYLFLAPLLQMLFQVACNQFLVIKKTWPNMLILSSGAILNIILNLCLIPELGIEGAAIATLIGYASSDIICVLVLCRMKLMVVSKRFLLSTVLTVIYLIGWRLFYRTNVVLGTILALSEIVVVLILYKKDLLILKKVGKE